MIGVISYLVCGERTLVGALYNYNWRDIRLLFFGDMSSSLLLLLLLLLLEIITTNNYNNNIIYFKKIIN